jgi:hypothetical protein
MGNWPQQDSSSLQQHQGARLRVGAMAEASRSAIQAALDASNGKATAFTIHDARDIVDVADKADDRLRHAGITEAETVGTIVTYRPRGPSANAYKNSAISTLVTIQKTQSGWYLVGVQRTTVYPRNSERITVNAKDKAVLAAARRLMKGISNTAFEIVPPAPLAQ